MLPPQTGPGPVYLAALGMLALVLIATILAATAAH